MALFIYNKKKGKHFIIAKYINKTDAILLLITYLPVN